MTATTANPGARGSLLAVAGRHRVRAELRDVVRTPAALGFTIAFPIVMLVLFGSIFQDDVPGTSVRYSQVYVSGIIASSLLSTGLVGLAIGVAIDRDNGLLKRLAGTPMPRAAYFLGKIGMVLVIGLAQIAAMLVIGMLMFGLRLPTDAGHWLTFAWVYLLGATASTLLGLAIGGLLPNAKSAPAILNIPFVALQFASGVFIPFDTLPSWLYQASGVFPLRWIAQAMRSVFLPDSFRTVELAGSWQHGTVFAVLVAWCVVGAVIASRSFRWVGRER